MERQGWTRKRKLVVTPAVSWQAASPGGESQRGAARRGQCSTQSFDGLAPPFAAGTALRWWFRRVFSWTIRGRFGHARPDRPCARDGHAGTADLSIVNSWETPRGKPGERLCDLGRAQGTPVPSRQKAIYSQARLERNSRWESCPWVCCNSSCWSPGWVTCRAPRRRRISP